LKNEVKKKMMIDSRKSPHQSHQRKNFIDECQPFFAAIIIALPNFSARS